MIHLEEKMDSSNPNWLKGIKRQLIENHGVNDIASDKLILEGEFVRYRLEYAAN